MYGRPNNNQPAPPLALVHPSFGSFQDDFLHGEIGDEDIQAANSLCASMSQFCPSETERSKQLDLALNGYLGGVVWSKKGVGRSSSDGSIMVRGDLLSGVKEIKKELCSNGSDPNIQACLYHGTWWADQGRDSVRGISPCPSFLLVVAGPYISVTGGAFIGEDAVYEPFTPLIPLNLRPTSTMIMSVARLLRALKNGISALNEYYSTLSDGADPKFPYPRKLSDGANLEYTAVLRAHTMFVAEAETGAQVVVKFVRRYGEKAHRLCARAGVAPPLLEVTPLPGGWFMVVYSFIHGVTLDASKLDAEVTPTTHTTPPASYTTCTLALCRTKPGWWVKL
jgi:hypothetical protein